MASAAGLWESASASNQFCLMGRLDKQAGPERDFADGSERDYRVAAHHRAVARRGGHLALVLSAIWPDPRRRRHRLCERRGDSFAGRHDLVRDGLAAAAAALRPRAGLQRFHRGVRRPDDRRPHHDVPLDLAEPQLSAGGLRQAGAGLAGHSPRDLGHSQRVHRPPGVAVGVAGRGAQRRRPACNRRWTCWIRMRPRSCSADCG